jgi:hypothetical protein
MGPFRTCEAAMGFAPFDPSYGLLLATTWCPRSQMPGSAGHSLLNTCPSVSTASARKLEAPFRR